MRGALLAAAIALLGAAAHAGDAPPRQQTAAPDYPWVRDKALIDGTIAEVSKNGILSVGPHAADLEQALAGAAHAFERAAAGDGDTTFVLTDGPTDTLMALAGATMDASRKKTGKTIAVANPYPAIAFYLATYYDESGKPSDALRVLDAALVLPDADFMVHRVDLLIERGAALAGLKRWADSLASYDAALKVDGTAPSVRAYVHRGRGFALTELGRLAEAEAAYRESLKLVADNPRALHELEYIEKLRHGGPPAPATLAPLQTPPAAPPGPADPALPQKS